MTTHTPTTNVTVWWSITATSPVVHLREDCVGLERTPAEARANAVVDTPNDLAREQWPAAIADHRDGPSCYWLRPCRVCALEPVLVSTIGLDRSPGPDRLLVSFTSQPAQRVDDKRFRHNKVSDTGRERLERIASVTGLHLAASSAGPAAWGFIDPGALWALEMNLRTVVLPFDGRVPTNDVVSVFWALFDGVQRGYEDGTFQEAWTTAWSLT